VTLSSSDATVSSSFFTAFAHAHVHQLFTISDDAPRDTKIAAANQPGRFSQKSGFGERR